MRNGIDPAQFARDLGAQLAEQMLRGVDSGQIGTVADAISAGRQASGITGASVELLRQHGFSELEVGEFVEPVVAAVREKFAGYRAGLNSVDRSEGQAN